MPLQEQSDELLTAEEAEGLQDSVVGICAVCGESVECGVGFEIDGKVYHFDTCLTPEQQALY